MNEKLTHWLLQHYGREQFRPDLTESHLSSIRKMVSPLFENFKNTRVITIAGTNGKGETTLRLSALLENSQHCVWTSPHIERITERFRNEHGEIEFHLLEKLILKCHEEVKLQGVKLSYYEFLFFVFCTWASTQKPEFLLLEVGLGGRLDAVNIFDAHLVLLPSISRDHQEFLGLRYDGILQEKLALLRSGSTLISYLSLAYLRERTKAITRTVQAEWIDLEELQKYDACEFASRNQFLAYAAFCFLKDPQKSSWQEKLKQTDWHPNKKPLEHRGEVIKGKDEWLFYGSHNVDGLRKLIQFLHSGNYNFSRPPFDAVLIAFSQRSRRDLIVMLKMIKASGLGPVMVTNFAHPKAADKEMLAQLANQEGLSFVENIESFVQAESEERKILVTGSYYFIGDIQSRYCR